MDDNNEIEELEIGLEVDNSELKESIDEAKDIIREGMREIENVLKNTDLGNSLSDSLTKNIEQAIDKAVKNASKNTGTVDIKANVTTGDKTQSHSKSMQSDKPKSSSGSGLGSASGAINVAAASNMTKASSGMKQASDGMSKGAKKIDGSGTTFKTTGEKLGTTTGKLEGVNTGLGTVTKNLANSSEALGTLGESSEKIGDLNKSLGNTVSKIGTANSILEGSSTKIGNVFKDVSVEFGNSAAAIYNTSYLMRYAGEAMGEKFVGIGKEFGTTTDGLTKAAGSFKDSGTDILSSGNVFKAVGTDITGSGSLFKDSSVKFEKGVQDLINQSKEKLYEANLEQIKTVLDSIASTMQAVLDGSKHLTERDYDRINNQLGEQQGSLGQIKSEIDSGPVSEGIKKLAEETQQAADVAAEVFEEAFRPIKEAKTDYEKLLNKLAAESTYISLDDAEFFNYLTPNRGGKNKGQASQKFYGGTNNSGNLQKHLRDYVGDTVDPLDLTGEKKRPEKPAAILHKDDNGEKQGFWVTPYAMQKDLIDKHKVEFGNDKEGYRARGVTDEELLNANERAAKLAAMAQKPEPVQQETQPEEKLSRSEAFGQEDSKKTNDALKQKITDRRGMFKNPNPEDNGKDTQDNQITTPNGITIVKRSKEDVQEKVERQDNYKNANEAFKQVTDSTPKLTKDDFPSEAKVAGGIEEGLLKDFAEKGYDATIKGIEEDFLQELSDVNDTDRREQSAKQDRKKRTASGSAPEARAIEEASIMREVPNLGKSQESAVALLRVLDEINDKYGNTLSTIESGNLSEILNNEFYYAIDGIEENGYNLSETLETVAQDLGENFRGSFEDVANEFDLDPSKMQQAYDTLKQSATSALDSVKDSGKDLLDQPISDVNKLKDTIENSIDEGTKEKLQALKEELSTPIEPKVNTESLNELKDKAEEVAAYVSEHLFQDVPAPYVTEELFAVDTTETEQKLDSIKARIKDFISNIGVAKGELGNLMKIDGANGFNVISQNIQSGIKSGVKGIKGLLNEIDSNNALKKLADDAKDAEERMDYLKERAEELNNTDTDKVEKEVEDVGKAAEGSALKLSDLINELKGYAGAYFGFEAIKTGITNAMQSIEIASTSASVFGDKLDEMNSWLKEVNDSLGLSYERTQRFTTSITQMGKTMGMSTGEAMTLSQQMALIAEQASRFYNVEIDTVYDDMKDAIVGSYDALEKYGIVLDEETVANYANADSLTKTQQAMQVSKLLAEQLGVSEEYLAESMNRPAVQASILRDNLGALSTALGRCFMPIVTVVLPLLNTLASALTTTLNNIANFISSVFGAFGVKVQGAASAVAQSVGGIGASLGDLGDAGGTGAAADGLDGVGESASGAAKEVEKLKGLMGFDEIQTIKTQQDPASGGSGGGSGSGGAGGGVGSGGVGTGSGDGADDSVSNGLKQSEEEINNWANRVGLALKAGWDSVSDYVNQSMENLKAAFAKLGTAISDFCVGAWKNGGQELFEAIGAFAGSVAGAVMDIVGQVVDAIANTINYLNPETNKFTAGFIGALTNAFNKVGELVRSLGGYFQTFLNNGGQAFLNVMGDIVMLVGTILAQVIADAASLVKAFFDSWAGQVIISTVAITLDIIAGAIKAVLIVINECLPVIEALGIAFGALKLIQISQDFTKVWSAISAGASPINAMTTTGGKLATKLGMLKANALLSKDALKKFVKDGVKGAIDSMGKLIQGTMKVTAQIGKSFLKAIASATTNVIKFGKNLITHPIQSMKKFGTAIADNVKKLGTWAKELAVKALDGVKKLAVSIGTAIAQMLGLSVANTTTAASTTALAAAEGTATAATGGLTLGAWALQAALSALGIGLIIAAIAGLVALIKNWDKVTEAITEKCGWLGKAMKAIGDACKWAWNGIKEFFGFSGENNIEEEVNDTEDELNGLGDTIEEVSDRFGSATSAINESLASIGIDGNKLALQLDAAEASYTDKFGLMARKSQEYLDALATGNEEVLNEMAGDADKYLNDISAAFNDMSLEEQAIFYATYDEIEGVTDGWVDYTKGSFEECLIKHGAMLESIRNDESLTYDEKKARINEETQEFITAQDEKLAKLNETIAEMEAQEWQSEEDKYQALQGYYEQRNQLVDEMNQYQIGAIETTADAQTKANEEMTTAADETATAQEEALSRVDTALETTKGNLTTFKTESEKVATEIPAAWEGVGETISDEFEGAIGDVGTNFNSILTNTKKQCDQLKSGIKKTFDEVKSGTKKSMLEVNTTITDQFNKAVSAVKKAGNDLKSNLQTTLNNIASGIKKSFDSIKTNMTTSFTQAASSVQKALNECKSKISSTLTSVNSDVSSKTNSIKNNIENNFRNVKSSLTKPFEGVSGTIGKSLDGIKSTISTRLDSILSKIKSSVSSMKKAMDFTFPKPYLRLPHINVRGDWNFETKQVPKFSVQWYAKGGIMTNPTAFGMNGNNLMVGGEAGPEAILPLDTLFDKMNDMFDNQNRTLASTLANNTHNTGPVTLIMEMDGEKVAKGTVKNMQDLARIGALDMTWL